MDVAPSPATIPVTSELRAAFWTWCANCGLGLEYSMEYKDCLIRCPVCEKLFQAEEKALESIIMEQIDRSIPHAPNHGAARASTVPASHPTMDTVATPATDVNLVAIPVALQMQAAVWTSCAFCGWELEYPMKYENCLLSCPHCKNQFEAKEKQLKSVIRQTDCSVHHAPNHGGVGTSAVPSSHQIMDSVPAPSVDVNPSSTQVTPKIQAAFWTSCESCGSGLEYPVDYKHSLVSCPFCHEPFKAEEKPLELIIGQTDSSVPHVTDVEVAVECVEAVSFTKNSSGQNLHHKSTHGALSMPGSQLVTKNESIQASNKRKRNEVSEHFGTDYKVSNNASFEKPPMSLRNQASPDVVIAELTMIPELSPMNSSIGWLNAFNLLRYNDFHLSSLRALPMDMRKAWLLNQIKSM